MTGRPCSLEQLNRYFAAATIAHEYVADMHRELAALGRSNDQTAELVRESAEVITTRLPALTRKLRDLASKWAERQLLDPAQAAATLRDIDAEFTEVEPELATLRGRQDEIAANLRARLGNVRRS